jgi:holin-like protein
MPPVHRHLFKFSRLLLQILVLIAIWLLASYVSAHWLDGFPPLVSGIAFALVLLALGLLKREWVNDGATWLIREMLLFFIPVAIAVLQYREQLSGKLLAIMVVIVASTACVMVATAFAVDLAWKLDARLRGTAEEKDPS